MNSDCRPGVRKFESVAQKFLRWSRIVAGVAWLILFFITPKLVFADNTAGSAEGLTEVPLSCGCGMYPGSDIDGKAICQCTPGRVLTSVPSDATNPKHEGLSCAVPCPPGQILQPDAGLNTCDPSKCASCVTPPSCGNTLAYDSASCDWKAKCFDGRVTVGSLVNNGDTRCVSPTICGPDEVLNCTLYDTGRVDESRVPPEQRRCCGCQKRSCRCGEALTAQANGDYTCVAQASHYYAPANAYDTDCPAGSVPDYGNGDHFANHSGGLGCVACRYCGCGYQVQGEQCVYVAGSWCPAGKYYDTNSCACQCSNTWYKIDVDNVRRGDMLTDNVTCSGKGKKKKCWYTNTGMGEIFSGAIPQCIYNTFRQIIQNSGFNPDDPTINATSGAYLIDYWRVNNGWPEAGGLVDDNLAAWVLGRAQGVRHGIWRREAQVESDPDGVLNGNAYFDSGCNRIDARTYNSLPAECRQSGGIKYAEESVDSPISLLWTDDATVIGTWYSKFPLNPEKSDKWYEWKASEKTPLLVYDPEHTGKIESATQLFGNYSFGKHWNDGYDALATLDQDGDGKIAGDELKPLGLWFDKNIDGVSQPGEVLSAEAVGLEALYFQDRELSDLNGYVYVEHGFDRKGAKGSESGVSVDWFARSYDVDPGKQAFNAATSPAGAWSWKTEEISRDGKDAKAQLASAGIITLADIGGKIEGHSYIELPTTRMNGGHQQTGIAVKMTQLTGTKAPNADGTTQLHWEVIHYAAGSRTVSDAAVSADNSHMTGTSKLLKSNGSVALEYSWRADRVPIAKPKDVGPSPKAAS
ncbi:MAG: hypothetical protein U0136_12565 [Bdellovibrionota bacterium]